MGWVCGGLVVGDCGERSGWHLAPTGIPTLHDSQGQRLVSILCGNCGCTLAWLLVAILGLGLVFRNPGGALAKLLGSKVDPRLVVPSRVGGDVPHCEWLLAHWLWLLGGGSAGGEWWLLVGALGNGGWVGCQPKMPSKLA